MVTAMMVMIMTIVIFDLGVTFCEVGAVCCIGHKITRHGTHLLCSYTISKLGQETAESPRTSFFADENHDFGGTGHVNSFLNTMGKLFLGAFARLRKTSVSFIMSVCSSVRPHGTTRLPLDGF